MFSVTIGIYTPDETAVVDLSEVAYNPTYVNLTLHRFILANNLKLFVS